MTDERTFTGWFGLLVLPDRGLGHKAEELAKHHARGAEYQVKMDGAHITLYQAHLRDVPRDFVSRLCYDLSEALRGKPLYLDRIAPYGEHHLFWEVAVNRHELWVPHYAACALAAFLDRKQYKGGTGPKLRLDKRRTLRHYGSTLIGEDYLPHITLAADPKGFRSHGRELRAEGKIDGVVFARMGEWGQIEEAVLPYSFLPNSFPPLLPNR